MELGRHGVLVTHLAAVEDAGRLLEEGFADVHLTPFAFDSLADGTPIYDSMRALYGQALAEAEAAGGELPPDQVDPSKPDPRF